MKTIQILSALLASAFLTASCSQPLTTTHGQTEGTSRGTLTISIPAVAPWLAQALAGQASGSRAYLHAAKAEVTLLSRVAETSDPTKDWEVVAGPLVLTAKTEAGTTQVSGDLTGLPPGHGYRLKVDLWAHDADPSPSFEGIADDVWVDANNNNAVSVGCLPLDALVSALPSDSSPRVVDGSLPGADAEAWYAFPIKPKTSYQVTVTTDAGVTAFGFNADGRIGFEGGSLSGETGHTWWYDNSDGKPFFVGVTGTQAGTFTITVKENPGVAIEGSLDIPAGFAGKRFQLTLDQDLSLENGNRCTLGWTIGDTHADYYITAVLPGTYYLSAKLDASGTWSEYPYGDPSVGDQVVKIRKIVVDPDYTWDSSLGIVAASDWEAYQAPAPVTTPSEIQGTWLWDDASSYHFQINVGTKDLAFHGTDGFSADGIIALVSVDEGAHQLVGQIVAHSAAPDQIGQFLKIGWTSPVDDKTTLTMYQPHDSADAALAETTPLAPSPSGGYTKLAPGIAAITGNWSVDLNTRPQGWGDTDYDFGQIGVVDAFVLLHGTDSKYLGMITDERAASIRVVPRFNSFNADLQPMILCYRLDGPNSMALGWYNGDGSPHFWLNLVRN
jgi:hypothetical protein